MSATKLSQSASLDLSASIAQDIKIPVKSPHTIQVDNARPSWRLSHHHLHHHHRCHQWRIWSSTSCNLLLLSNWLMELVCSVLSQILLMTLKSNGSKMPSPSSRL